MQTNKTTNVLLGIIVIVLIAIACVFFSRQGTAAPVATDGSSSTMPSDQGTGTPADTDTAPPVTTAPAQTIPAGMKQYSDSSFGFSFMYPQALAVSTDASGNVTLTGTAGTTTVVKTTNTAPDSTGKWGPYTISYSGTGFVAQQQSDEDGSMHSVSVTPIATTASGLPIFNGGIPEHGFGKYDYIVALSHTKFLTISGPDMTGSAAGYSAATDPTLAVAMSVIE